MKPRRSPLFAGIRLRPFRTLAIGLMIASQSAAQTTQTIPRPPAGVIEFTEAELKRILRHSPLPDPPADPTNRWADHPGAVELGRLLFFEPRLSATGDTSCATCHDPAKSFTDGRALSQGAGPGLRNTMSLWNVAYNRWFFWDGRADTLWSQALQPIERDIELNGSRTRLARLLFADEGLRRAYESVFGDPPDVSDPARFPEEARPAAAGVEDAGHRAWSGMSESDREQVNQVFVNAGKAIAAFERRLLSRRAPFDVFVEGLREGDPVKASALSESAQRGLKFFMGEGNCFFCHAGPNFTDNEFHNIRVPPLDPARPPDSGRFHGAEQVLRDPFNALGPYSDERSGAAADKIEFLANSPENWGRVKTPSLRNVATTAPYMHQGQFADLDAVLRYYSTLEGAVTFGHHDRENIIRPLNLTPEQMADLRAFLESLTDTELPPDLLDGAAREPPGRE